MTKRDYFEQREYETLVKTIDEMAADGVKVRGVLVTQEFKYLFSSWSIRLSLSE